MRLPARALLLTLSGLALIADVAGPAQARAHATRDGVVVVLTSLGYEGGAAAGTGMVLTSSGRVLTNNHVIAGATSVRVSVPKTGHTYSAHVVGYDVPDDVAVLQLDNASGLTTVTRESSPGVSVGDTVTAVGNAGGTGTIATAGGKVTRVRRTITVRDDHGRLEKLAGLIETSTHVQPGDSGGALLNSSGRVVGMITAASGSDRFRLRGAASNAAFAIPIAKAAGIAQKILTGRGSTLIHVGPTAFLGVQVGAVDAGSGASIAGVVPDGPADSAGLAAGDVITAVAGKRVTAPSDISTILLTKKPGMRIEVGYVDGSHVKRSAVVTLASGPPQ